MKRRKIQRTQVREESFFRLLFALLLFLSVLRVIDLLPDAKQEAVPAIAPVPPAPPIKEEKEAPLSLEGVNTARPQRYSYITPIPPKPILPRKLLLMCRLVLIERRTPARACWR